jgi:hypothetical protein
MRTIAVAFALALAACSPTTLTHGVPNFAVVDATSSGSAADPYIVRSGQIATAEGWDYLATIAHGRHVHVIKLNFDHEGSDAEVIKRGWTLVYVPIQPEGDLDIADDAIDAWRTPDAQNIARAKAELEVCRLHPDTELCDFHCTHGQDRTGEVAGEYRVDRDGWTKERAYAEMRAHNYHPELHGLHERWEGYMPAAPAR